MAVIIQRKRNISFLICFVLFFFAAFFLLAFYSEI